MTSVFDVVVVGGGAAGCVVAARLAERTTASVLLLEAGPDRRRDLPPGFRNVWDIVRGQFEWGYSSEPSPAGHVQPARRTRMLGGTSWVTRFTPRGSPADYDAWASAGNPGWEFSELLPYFIRLEHDLDFGDRAWHGDAGPIPSTRHLDIDPLPIVDATTAALESRGFEAVADHNRPGAVGVGRMPMNGLGDSRVTTVDAYLAPGQTPANLTIRGDAQVDRILFDGERAGGVRLVDGTEVRAGAVVLSAGVYGSPAILLRSGIGPPDELCTLGIEVVVDLPAVGSNLADHPAVTVECGVVHDSLSAPRLHSIATFRSEGRGSTESPDLMLWFAEPDAQAGESAPYDIEVVLLKPESRGRVSLRSNDPADAPRIELPLVSEQVDLVRLAEGYRVAADIAGDPAIRTFCEEGRRITPPTTELRELIRAELYSIPHVVGTCAMGRNPEGAVVDALGRVHGADQLLVIDASIMPDVPSGFTHIPTIMIAERLSEQLARAL